MIETLAESSEGGHKPGLQNREGFSEEVAKEDLSKEFISKSQSPPWTSTSPHPGACPMHTGIADTCGDSVHAYKESALVQRTCTRTNEVRRESVCGVE